MSLRTLLFAVLVSASATVMADEQLELGKKVFTEQAQPSCTICHALNDAGSVVKLAQSGRAQTLCGAGPNAVKSGVGIMPAFGDSLSEQQIEAVAHYVESVTGK